MRRLPEQALELLAGAGELWVSPHDRPLDRAELHAAVAGADAGADPGQRAMTPGPRSPAG